MRQIFNYHTHTYRCGHAALESDEEYIQSAIKAGFKVIGMSDHAPYPDYSKKTDRMDFEEMEGYLNSILELKEKYKDQIEVRLGFEMEYLDHYVDTKYYDFLLSKVEYLIQGQHYYLPDGNFDYCHDKSTKEIIEEYGRLCCEGMKSGKYLYLAHPDYFCGSIETFDETCQKVARDIAETAVATNTPLEVNIKLVRRTKKDFGNGKLEYVYPLRAFWEIVSQYPVKCVYGFDAHNAELLENQELYNIADEILEGLDLEFIEEPLLK